MSNNQSAGPAPALTSNPDGLWRSYYGSGQFHHYDASQLRAAWHHQVADCGRKTRTATGNFSPFRPELHKDMRVCAKCRRINLAPNQPIAGYTMDPFFECRTREDHVQVLLREYKCLLEDDDVMRALRTMTIAQIKAVYWAVFKVLSLPFEMKVPN
jgi:hypothetical protein